MENELMVVRQLPIIEEQLRSVQAEIEAMTKDAMSLACTEDSYRDVKKVRADLRKKFETLEERRKQIKDAVMAPYIAFEETYKQCVSSLFNKADADLKKKIDDIENGLKADKTAEVVAYYNELLQSEGLDWIAELGYKPKVTMSVTTKALKEQAKDLVYRYVDDAATIDALPDRDEIMVEYRKTLDANGSIKAVAARHAALEEQKRRSEERQKRQEEEQQWMAEAQQLVAENAAKEMSSDPDAVISAAKEARIVEPMLEKSCLCKFYAKGTKDQLKALKDFMERSGIEYGSL